MPNKLLIRKGKLMRGLWSQRGTVLGKIAHNHFSFYKGVLLGFNPVEMYERYIEHPGAVKVDPRVLKSIQKWIVAELIRLAGRYDRHSGIRLLKIEPVKLTPSVAMAESLEAFEDRMGYGGGMMSQAELLEAFQEHYADNPEIKNNAKKARIRQKQLDLLAFLVSQDTAKPGQVDLLSGWLEPTLVKHFEAAGVHTVGELVAGINAYGKNWHRKIPGIGAKAANHIVKWLCDDEVEKSMGVKIKTSALLPSSVLRHEPPDRKSETAIVPFEHFKLPESLDGRDGNNLHAKAKRQAQNDQEAIALWLKSVKPGSTFRAYRKEAERFLLWCVLERQKPFSSIALDDCISYRNFLHGLGSYTPTLWHQQFTIPQSDWMASRSCTRRSTLWRPFEGQLSDLSQKYALNICFSLCEFLVKIRYLDSNPFVGLTLIVNAKNKINVSHSLIKSDLIAIREYLAPRQKEARYRRIDLVLTLAYSTGLRMSELAKLKRSNFNRFIRLEDSVERWQIKVVGKGQKEREIPLSPALIEHLNEFRYLEGLNDFDLANPNTPIISALGKPMEPLGHDRIYQILKEFFSEFALSLPPEQSEQAARVEVASTHWLRHTFAVKMLESGASLEVVRDLLGHSSLATTSIYVSTERDRRSRQMDEFIEKAGF